MYFSIFEKIVRRAHLLTDEKIMIENVEHPFDLRNIHQLLPKIVKKMFDDGYFAQATFEAFKFLDKQVARISNESESGVKLMMKVFNIKNPKIKLSKLLDQSAKDEQQGYQFLFSGSILAIRNPRGHDYKIYDSIEECLDHLSLVSLLIRRIEKAGYKIV